MRTIEHLRADKLGEFPLGSTPGPSTPVNILHGVITMKPSVTDGVEIFFDSEKSRFVTGMTIDEFFNGHAAIDFDLIIDSPLDINVCEPLYVVFELDSKFTWHFRPGDIAVTTQEDRTANYTGLRHVVNRGGPSMEETAPEDIPCRLVYFWVDRPPPVALPVVRHKFNLYVHLPQDGAKVIKLIIDPDIKDTGPPSHA